jgi:hypothetical protein
MRDVAEFYVLVRGLRLAVGDDRAVPFATAWVGWHLDWSKITVWRALRRLVEAGVLLEPVALPGRGKRGTHSYLPGAD